MTDRIWRSSNIQTRYINCFAVVCVCRAGRNTVAHRCTYVVLFLGILKSAGIYLTIDCHLNEIYQDQLVQHQGRCSKLSNVTMITMIHS